MPIEDGVERGFVGRDALRADALQRYTIQVRDMFPDVAEAKEDSIRSTEDLSAALPIACTIDAQPDVPRTITWKVGYTNITAFTLAIAGVNAKGYAVTETFTEADGWFGETSNALATLTGITVLARTGTGTGDVMDVGCGSKLGLSNALQSASSVFKVTRNKADYPAAGYTVDADFDTVDVSPGGAIVTDDDFCISYRRALDSCDEIS